MSALACSIPILLPSTPLAMLALCLSPLPWPHATFALRLSCVLVVYIIQFYFNESKHVSLPSTWMCYLNHCRSLVFAWMHQASSRPLWINLYIQKWPCALWYTPLAQAFWGKVRSPMISSKIATNALVRVVSMACVNWVSEASMCVHDLPNSPPAQLLELLQWKSLAIKLICAPRCLVPRQ